MSIAVKNLSFEYGVNSSVLEDISFELDKGEILSCLGPNGVGKTTLFRCLLRQLHPMKGSIFIDECDIKELSRRKLSRKLAYIPQFSASAFDYTIVDTVLMGTTATLSPLSLPGKEQYDAAYAAIETIGITKPLDTRLSQLSGGEKQLVYIARALAQRSEILVMDEPTASLDYGNQIKVMKVIQKIAKQGYTVLISMHNPEAAVKYSTKTLALKDNRVFAFGNPSEIITEEFINELYGIDGI